MGVQLFRHLIQSVADVDDHLRVGFIGHGKAADRSGDVSELGCGCFHGPQCHAFGGEKP